MRCATEMVRRDVLCVSMCGRTEPMYLRCIGGGLYNKRHKASGRCIEERTHRMWPGAVQARARAEGEGEVSPHMLPAYQPTRDRFISSFWLLHPALGCSGLCLDACQRA